jgi:hypothetical protein
MVRKPLEQLSDSNAQKYAHPQLPTGSRNEVMMDKARLRAKYDNDLAIRQKTLARISPQPEVPTIEEVQQPNPQYRATQGDVFRNQNPKSFEEMLSGVMQAVQKYPTVDQSLLLDKFFYESSGDINAVQNSGGPGRGGFQFEMPLPEDLARTARSIGLDDFNPFDATQSALLAAHEVANGRLSRWGVPQKHQKKPWGTLDYPGKESLVDVYGEEYLNKLLPERFQF